MATRITLGSGFERFFDVFAGGFTGCTIIYLMICCCVDSLRSERAINPLDLYFRL
jgi:hypothetical protein